jgi:hypothetical protein
VRYEFRPLEAWTDPETRSRERAPWTATWQSTLDMLARELGHLGVKMAVIQVDASEADLRRDGMPRGDAVVGHPGVIVSFESRFGPLRYAADTYRGNAKHAAWQANLRAIALTLQALRSVDRYGATKRGEQYQGWTAIEAPKPTFADWHAAAEWMRDYAINELRIPHDAGGDWNSLYRAMAKKMHPDQGHPRADWDRLDEARRMLQKAGML